MLVSIIYHKTKVPYLVQPTCVINESIIGTLAAQDGTLNQERVVNTSQFGAPTVRVSRRYLAQTRVTNTSQFGAPVIQVVGTLVQTRVTNTSQFGSPTVRVSKRFLQQTKLINTSVVFPATVLLDTAETFETPSYANAGGIGDRTAIITVTTTAVLNIGPASKWVDNNFDNNSNSIEIQNGQTLRSITFDFGHKALITEVKYYQNGSGSQGTWKWQGSNDGSSFTDLSATFNMDAGGAGDVVGDLSANTIGYRYYRALQTSGTTNSSPWSKEFEFKIGNIIT